MEQNNALAENKPMEIALPEHVKKTEFGGIETTKADEQIAQIRSYVRSKVLRQFNIAEIAKTPVPGGGMFFNGNRTNMRLPKVKINPDGGFAETVVDYYNRSRADIKRWLVQALQNSSVTVEQVEAIL